MKKILFLIAAALLLSSCGTANEHEAPAETTTTSAETTTETAETTAATVETTAATVETTAATVETTTETTTTTAEMTTTTVTTLSETTQTETEPTAEEPPADDEALFTFTTSTSAASSIYDDLLAKTAESMGYSVSRGEGAMTILLPEDERGPLAEAYRNALNSLEDVTPAVSKINISEDYKTIDVYSDSNMSLSAPLFGGIFVAPMGHLQLLTYADMGEVSFSANKISSSGEVLESVSIPECWA